MIDSTANGFRLIVAGTRTGELLAAGYESGLIFLQNNAVLDINFRQLHNYRIPFKLIRELLKYSIQ